MTRHLFAIAAVLFLAGVSFAEVESGPKAGEKLAELKAHGISGTGEGKETDYTADRKEAPTVFVFVNAEKWGRPTHRFIKTLDEKIADVEKAGVVGVWVGGEVDKNKEYLPKIKQYYGNTWLGVSAADGNGPNGWGLNSSAHLTVVVAHKGKVVKSFAYDSVNETDVKDVMASLKAAVEAKEKK